MASFSFPDCSLAAPHANKNDLLFFLFTVFDYECLPGGGDQDGEPQDCDGPASVLQNADISQSYRRTLPAKRPSPCGPVSITPGVATIRRAPTSKPSLWRGPSVHGPIPIKTPVIPVKTPTVPLPPLSGVNDTDNVQLKPKSLSQSDAPVEQDKMGSDEQEGSMLSSIRRGVSLKKATTNDRSAPVLE